MNTPCFGDITELSVKVLSAVGGFLGGTSMLMYMRPVDMTDAIRRMVISVLSAVMLTGLAAKEMFSVTGPEIIMGTAFCIGFIAWSLLGAVAKFFEGRQNQDIVQMMKAVNEARSPSVQPYYPPMVQSHHVDNPDE